MPPADKPIYFLPQHVFFMKCPKNIYPSIRLIKSHKIPCLMDRFKKKNPFSKPHETDGDTMLKTIPLENPQIQLDCPRSPNISPVLSQVSVRFQGGSTAARTVSAFCAATFASSSAAWPGIAVIGHRKKGKRWTHGKQIKTNGDLIGFRRQKN